MKTTYNQKNRMGPKNIHLSLVSKVMVYRILFLKLQDVYIPKHGGDGWIKMQKIARGNEAGGH